MVNNRFGRLAVRVFASGWVFVVYKGARLCVIVVHVSLFTIGRSVTVLSV